MQHRRDTLRMIGGAMALAAAPALAKPAQRPPNIIVVVADDLGWGDLGSYGNRQIATPNLDRMAREGLRMTDFHASANVCTPSRAGLMTGRYPIRTGLGYDVIQAKATNGLPPSEITLAKALRPTYATGLFGKWHLGHVTPYWPPAVHGFDRYFGIPYSNDMQPLALYSSGVGNELTSTPVDQTRLTEQFFGAATDFITQNKAKPFLAMVMLSAPHQPLFPRKLGDGAAGKYGDVVGEIDAGMGRLFATLKQLGLDRDTMVIFTSDNGPWFQGSAGGFRDRKGGAGWEGGYRVPLIVRQPGVIPAGQESKALGMNIDFLPTMVKMARMPMPAGVTIDGRDLMPTWTKGAASPHDELILFDNEKVAAIRTKRWKYLTRSYYRTYDVPLADLGLPLLFDLDADPAENYDVAASHPEVAADMAKRFAAARAEFEPLGVRKAADKPLVAK